MIRAALCLAACLLAPLAAHAQSAKPPSPLMLEIFGKDAGKAKAQACFTRVYDAAHLAAHPQQNVRDMVLLLEKSPDADVGLVMNARVGVHFRKLGARFETGGSCGIGADGQAVRCGVDCDGGQIDVDVRDGQTVLVKIPDGARLWDPKRDDNDTPRRARFGKDDTLFKLSRADLRACASVLSKQ